MGVTFLLGDVVSCHLDLLGVSLDSFLFTVVPLLALLLGIGYSLVATRDLGDVRPLVLALLLGLMATHQVFELVGVGDGVLDLAISGELPETGANLLASLGSYFVLAFLREERSVREALAEKSAELEQLNHVNALLRDTNRGLALADNRDAIDQAVCEQFLESGYAGAMILETGLATDEPTVRSAAGLDEDGILPDGGVTDHGEGGVLAQALEAGEVGLRRNPDGLTDPACDLAPGVDCRAVAAVPLVYAEAHYGCLVVIATDGSAFEGLESTLAELGSTIAHAINAVESKQTLLTDNVVELEFAHEDPAAISVDLSQRFDCRVDLEWLAVGPDQRLELYLGADIDTPETVLAYAAGREGVDVADHLNEHGDRHLFRIGVSDTSIVATLADYGAVVTELSAADGVASVTAHVSNTESARSVVRAIENTHQQTELVGTRERERRLRTKAELQSTIAEDLTDRQQEALYTSYAAGYFEWPRENSSEEIADIIGIAQSTFLQHLRAANRKLLGILFDEPDTYRDVRVAERE